MSLSLFTIGHSTHHWDGFLALLAQHQIQALVDIRRFPGSRKFPQFGQDHLKAALPEAGVHYFLLEALGGRRRKEKGESSPNLGLRNESFRNYADYMSSGEFLAGIEKLKEFASEHRTAIMCAEGLFWQCHRRLVSDYLVTNQVTVQHIMPNGGLRPHTLTAGAKIDNGEVTYPGDKSLFD